MLEILPGGRSFASKPHLGMVLNLAVPQVSRCKMGIRSLTTQGGSGNTLEHGETTYYYSDGEGFCSEEILCHFYVFKGLGTLIHTETPPHDLCSLFYKNLLEGRNLLHPRMAYSCCRTAHANCPVVFSLAKVNICQPSAGDAFSCPKSDVVKRAKVCERDERNMLGI